MQLCEPFKVTLDLDEASFTFARSKIESFQIRVPEALQKAHIETFLPVISPDESTVMIALRFPFNFKQVYEHDKYHRMLVCNLDSKEAMAMDDFGTFCKMWFETDKQAIVQQ